MLKNQKREFGKTNGNKTHGIVLDEKSQEQPSDKERARSAAITEDKITEDKEDELQPLKEKSGF
jgi:hypothetical protein